MTGRAETEGSTSLIAEAVVRRLVDLACLAPSVHNTQPWQWRIEDERVLLFVDRSRMLPHEDPEGRNTYLSCGAALDHLVVAAGAFGLKAAVTRLPVGNDGDLLAIVQLSSGEQSGTAAEDIALLRARCTDRRRFTSWPVPVETLEQLAQEARARGAEAMPVTDLGTQIRLELITRRAHLLRALDPAATGEQRRWVGDSRSDGLSLAVLPAEPGPASLRFAGGYVRETRALVDSSDGVIVVGGAHDEPRAWLRSGEALSALWLRATSAGLSVVPMSLPVEVDEVRADLRSELFGGEIAPHILVRIGWQAIGRSELPRTPRRPLDEVLRS